MVFQLKKQSWRTESIIQLVWVIKVKISVSRKTLKRPKTVHFVHKHDIGMHKHTHQWTLSILLGTTVEVALGGKLVKHCCCAFWGNSYTLCSAVLLWESCFVMEYQYHCFASPEALLGYVSWKEFSVSWVMVISYYWLCFVLFAMDPINPSLQQMRTNAAAPRRPLIWRVIIFSHLFAQWYSQWCKEGSLFFLPVYFYGGAVSGAEAVGMESKHHQVATIHSADKHRTGTLHWVTVCAQG